MWQNINYFSYYKAEIIDAFKFKRKISENDQNIKDIILNTNSVAVHVRRGDFQNSKFDICGKNYYDRAIKISETQLSDPHYYIFSDDPEHIEDQFSYVPNKTIIRHSAEDSIFDMELMGACKVCIISNSTFSFWAAYLSKNNPIVIAPKYSLRDDVGSYELSVPNEWIVIDPFLS